MNLYRIAILVFILFVPHSALSAARDGTINTLTASGGANPGETITISVSFQANSRINNSTFIVQIISPSGVVVDTHNYSPPRLQAGESGTYSWTSDNTGYPEMGNYTLVACWRTGNSNNPNNCNIDSASVVFYSADSLGPFLILGIAAGSLLLFRLYKQETA